jgi:acetylglutamate kinase
MPDPLAPAAVLLRAADRVRALAGRPVVVKLGGSAMEDPAATRGTLTAVHTLHTLGVRPVLVHGGGKPIDRAMAAAGLTPVKFQGRRYTDDAALQVVVRVLRELNEGLVDILYDLKAAPAGFNDRDNDGHPLRGERLLLPGLDLQPVDLGHVGKPTVVDVERLNGVIVGRGEIPIIPSLAVGPDGGWLNVNADTAASAVAGGLNADACVFLTDTPGVLRDVNDPGSLLPRLTRAEGDALIRDGVIAGGMVPKVEACFQALDAGAGRAVILDGRNPHALLTWFLGQPAGTEIVP